MTEFKEGDRVRVTQTYEGTVRRGSVVGLRVMGDDGSTHFPDPDHPNTTIEKIAPPMPDEPGTVLWVNRNFCFMRTSRFDWIDPEMAVGSPSTIESLWKTGNLSTERPQ